MESCSSSLVSSVFVVSIRACCAYHVSCNSIFVFYMLILYQ